MRTMKTWQDFAGNTRTATTRWNYHPQRGWLASKDYPDPATGSPPEQPGTGGPQYTNWPSGRLAQRTWKRGVATQYTYNAAGDLAAVNYSGSTPDVSYGYDRQGQRTNVACNGVTTSVGFNGAGAPLTEAYSGGTLAGLAMNWTYDTALRRSGLSAMSGTNALQAAGYTYDTAGRLWKVSDGSVEAAYGYAANSSLVSSLTLTNSGAAGSVANRVWDRLGRLMSVSTRAYGSGAPGLPFGFEYQYNRAHHRTWMKLADGSYWVYQYDALGQVISGKRYWSDGTPVAGQQFEYGFDDIGNRKSTGGRASAASSYTNNLLNQITGRSVAPYVDVAGVANPTTNVTVSAAGQTFTAARWGDYFHHALSVPNSSAQYPTVEVTSAFTNWTESGQVYVPATPEVFTYDADGNLTSDGRWTYTWDGENRLVEMKRDAASPSGARIWLVFEYDAQGRRIRKTVSTNAGGGWVEQTDAVFLYDGWNVMAELDANAAKARLRTYVWGIDLSGSLQGAGGVGGLLWVNNYQTAYQEETLPTGVHFVVYDGNGNVMALVKAADATVSGRYEYGPFAEPVRVGGALAKAQPFRFSTKWTDAESGLVYYGYRYYSPMAARWMGRDPIEEGGGPNLYATVRNAPTIRTDGRGLSDIRSCPLCGVNVTAAVERTMLRIEQVFWSEPDEGVKREACRNLYFNYAKGGERTWDIYPLYQIGCGNDWHGWYTGVGSCSRTVTFKGRCYYAGSVNYVMWGLANRMCKEAAELYHWSWHELSNYWLWNAKLFVWGHKASCLDCPSERCDQAIALTEYGYGLPLTSGGLHWCSPNGKAVSERELSRHWNPVHRTLPRRTLE